MARFPRHPDVIDAIARSGYPSIAAAARQIGRRPRYVQKVLRGGWPMSAPLARDLADLLDLDEQQLLSEREKVG